jgi:hypothetical protein
LGNLSDTQVPQRLGSPLIALLTALSFCPRHL